MPFIVYALIWAVLFTASYLTMCWRAKLLHLVYDASDFNPTLIVSLIVPPIGIIFALADIAAFKLGLRKSGDFMI